MEKQLINYAEKMALAHYQIDDIKKLDQPGFEKTKLLVEGFKEGIMFNENNDQKINEQIRIEAARLLREYTSRHMFWFCDIERYERSKESHMRKYMTFSMERDAKILSSIYHAGFDKIEKNSKESLVIQS